MAKEPLAIVSMVYNEPDFLPIWIKYYSLQVNTNNLYVIDHGSTDGCTFGLAPINIVRVPRCPLDEHQRAKFISEFANSLLNWYECVIYTDIDEIIVADPRHYASLRELSANTSETVITAIGMHIVPGTSLDPVLMPMAPILRQRQWALGVGSMSKPVLIKRSVQWSPGFHYANADTQFGDIFLFHLAYCDIEIVRRRQQKRLTVEIVSNHGSHHGISADEFVEHLESWITFPQISSIDLGRLCQTRASFVVQLFETRRAGNSLQQIDATVTAGAIWHIPERLRGFI